MTPNLRLSERAIWELRKRGWDVYSTAQEDVCNLAYFNNPNGIQLARDWDRGWFFQANASWGWIQYNLADFLEILLSYGLPENIDDFTSHDY